MKNVRPNLHSKFTTRAQAQKFVDERGARKSPTTVDEDEQQKDEGEEEDKQGEGGLAIDAEDEGQVCVFACHTDVGTARIALTFDKAIAGVKNPAVQVINSKSSLLDNLAEAEVRLRKDKQYVRKSLTDRLEEARARAQARRRTHTKR